MNQDNNSVGAKNLLPLHTRRKRRQSMRLKHYNYASNGAYFVTICTHNRECLFGDIVDEKMILNNVGKIAQQCWLDIPKHFPQLELDHWIVMPNHVHGILTICDTTKAGAKDFLPLQHGTSKTIGSIVRGFKIGVMKWVRQNTSIDTIWQRNYYEHIIRDEKSLDQVREYIQNNPLKWELDENNPNCRGKKSFAPT